jgi:DNA-binding FadR family transcriptional regulator
VTPFDKLSFGEQFTDMVRLRRMTVEQLYDARLLIEPEVVRIVLKNITKKQIRTLREQVSFERISLISGIRWWLRKKPLFPSRVR